MKIKIDENYKATKDDVIEIRGIRYTVFKVLPDGVRAGNGLHINTIRYHELVEAEAEIVERNS